MQNNGDQLPTLPREAKSASLTIGGAAALVLFLSNHFEIFRGVESWWLEWLLGVGCGLVLGAAYYFLLAKACARISPEHSGALRDNIAILHLPLWTLAIYPLALRVVVYKTSFPAFNDSLFTIFGLVLLTSIARVFLPDKQFKYAKSVLKYLFFLLLSLILVQAIGAPTVAKMVNQASALLGAAAVTDSGIQNSLNSVFQIFDINTIVAIGLITLFLHRHDVRESEDKEAQRIDTLQGEKTRTYPADSVIGRIPVIRTLARRLRAEGWLVSILLLVIVAWGSVHIFYRLGFQDFYNDEFHTIAAAKGFAETGTFKTWRWHKTREWNLTKGINERIYKRAWPHTLMVAGSIKAFGLSEWSGRLPSALLGVLFYFILYFVSKSFWKNRWYALVTVFVFIFSETALFFFRQARMYPLLAVFSLPAFYYLFRWLNENNTLPIPGPWLSRFVNRYFNFNLKALLAFLVFFSFALVVHINVAIFIPFILVFVIWLTVFERTERYLLLVVLGAILVGLTYLLVARYDFLSSLGNYVTFFDVNNSRYYKHFFEFPAGFQFTFAMTALGLGALLFDPRRERRRLLAAFLLVTAVCLVFFVWIADRWDARRYAFHVMILFNIMVLGMFGMVTTMYPKFIRAILVLLLVGSVAIRLTTQKSDLYDEATMYGRLSKAYAKIVDEIDPEKEVVVALYYHIFSYYLDGIPENTKFIHIKKEKQLSREELIQILHDNKQGWIVWPYYKNWHIRRDVLGYIRKHFRNESPRGSKTVLYYFNRDMMENPKRKFQRRPINK